MKKRILAIVLCFVFIISFAACSDQEKTEKKLISEGEDTKCEVEFKAYSGVHSGIFLSQGDKIAVISPSALPSREQTDSTIKGLKDWGYDPVEGKHVCEENRTIDDILEDLEWALKDPEIKAVFCVRGGYGASEVADRLSEELIKKSDKLIIGYSDITVYHSAWTAAGLPSVHACMSGTFTDFPEACFEAEERILKGEMPSYQCESSSNCKTGEAKGILVGGNLSTFTSVIGTAYDCTKMEQPYILFLEDIGEDVQHLHRYLTILKHTGILDHASGIVFGEWTELPEDLGDYFGKTRGGDFRSIEDMISRQFLGDLHIPVAFGFPAGHGDTNYPLLMGEMAELKVTPESYRLICGADGAE